MSSSAMRTPLVRHIALRGYAAEACARPVGKTEKVVSAKLPNNTFVASVDNGNPVTRVAIAFRAGSRYEPQSELGISHVLRSTTGLTTKTASNFIVRRQLTQLGATLSATGDREFITYTLEVGKDNLRDAVKLLTASISQPEFRPWEIEDNNGRISHDITTLPAQVRAVDLLHKAAFRRTLGNSLFISPRRIGKVSSESLQHFVANYLTPERCAVTVVGDNQDRAVAIAQSLLLGSGKGNDVASTYCGGDTRKEMGGELTHIAIALEGAKAGTPEALALAVAAKGLGNGPVTKWGADNSPLAKAIGNVGPFAAAGFNLSYQDSGLFGVILSVPKDEAGAAVRAVAKVLKSGNLAAEAVKAGKAHLKLQVLSEQEQSTSLAEQISSQGLISGTAKSTREIAEQIEGVSASDVSKALSAAAKTKLSMGAAGNLQNVPYVDEI